MPLTDYIERFFSWLFMGNRANDDLMFTKSPAFANMQDPTIEVTSPDGGPNNCFLKLEHTQDGDDTHPTLSWTLPPSLTADAADDTGKTRVYEYLVICEDADLPAPRFLAKSLFHSLFYHIPGTKTQFTDKDATAVPSSSQELRTEGGYRYVKNMRGGAYMGAKPLIGHGEHRYLYQVVALSEPLDLQAIGEKPNKAKMADAVVGKVAGWGVWMARYNRTPT